MRILKDEHLEKIQVLTIDAESVGRDMRTWLLENAHAVKKQGFRPGKLPLPLLFKEKGRQAIDAVIQSYVSQQFDTIVGNRDVAGPLNYRVLTNLDDISLDQSRDIEVEITAVFSPDIPEIRWSDITVDHWKIVPSSDDIDQWLQDKAKKSRRIVALSEKRPARKGDVLVYTMQYTCADGTGHETEGMMTLGSGMLPSEFEETLEGIEEGHVVTERLRVPKGFPQAELVGKKVQFTITFKEIKETASHEINDEFAVAHGFASLDEMKEKATKDITESGEVLSGVLMRRDLKQVLGTVAEFDVPTTWVNNLASSLAAPSTTITDEIADKARMMVRAESIVRHVVKKEKLKAQDRELFAYMQVIAQQQKQSIDQVVGFFQKNHRAAQAMTDEILERKALNWIGEHCTKVEKQSSLQEVNKRLNEHQNSLIHDSESQSIMCTDDGHHEGCEHSTDIAEHSADA